MTFQPSEIAKFAVIVVFAHLIDRNYKPKPAYYIVRDLAGEK